MSLIFLNLRKMGCGERYRGKTVNLNTDICFSTIRSTLDCFNAVGLKVLAVDVIILNPLFYKCFNLQE